MRGEPHLHAGFVVQREAVDDVGAGTIVANYIDRAPVTAQAGDDLVECAHP